MCLAFRAVRARVDDDGRCITHRGEIARQCADDQLGRDSAQIARLLQRLRQGLQVALVFVPTRRPVVARTRQEQDLFRLRRDELRNAQQRKRGDQIRT